MDNDLISRSALKETFENLASDDYNEPIWYQQTVFETIDNAPTVEIRDNFDIGYVQGLEDGQKRPQGEWIPIKTRPLTEEEKEEYPDYSFMYDCQLPDDGQEVLVTSSCGYVRLDTFYRDDGCYFEYYCDEGDVVAWQPLPEPYKGVKDNER